MNHELDISAEYKSIQRDVLATLPKAILRHDVTARCLTKEIARLASEGVVYVELWLPVTPNTDLAPLIDAMGAASQEHGITARLVLAAESSDSARAVADLAVANRGPVVGVSLVEPEDEIAAYLRENFLPLSVVAADMDAIFQAVAVGADRISGALGLYEDFSVDLEGIAAGPLSAYVRDREIPLEMSLRSDDLEDIGDHPLPLLQQLGFTCTLNPQRYSAVEEMELLVEGFDYGLEELFELTVTAMENAFAPIELRRAILEERIAPAFQQFADTEEYEELESLASDNEDAFDDAIDDEESELTIEGLD